MRSRDSLQKAKEEEKELRNDLKNIKDTLQSEDNPGETEFKSGKTKSSNIPDGKPDATTVKKEMMDTNRQRQPSLHRKDTLKK
jgi:hypothetical protein